jgi:hypothetical protein
MGGAIFETAVLIEIYKTLACRGETPRLYFWRTSTGVEVDILVETETALVPVEVKLSSTPLPAMAAAIRSFREDLGSKAAPGFVVHGGDVRLPLAPSVTAIPFSSF